MSLLLPNAINNSIVLNCQKDALQCEFILKENFISGIISSGRYQYHFHSTYEIHIPVIGIEHIMVQDTDVYVRPGEVCIIPPNTVHFVFPSEKNFCTGFRFDFSRTSGEKTATVSLFEKAFGRLKGKAVVEKCPIYRKYLSVVIDNLNDSLPSFMNADLLFLSLYETAIALSGNVTFTEKNRKNSDILLSDKIEEYLNAHYSEKILLEELSEYLNFSRRQTERIIARLFGMTFCELVNQKRLLVSKLLLKTTDLSIEKIAHNVGFEDHHYFYRKFTSAFSTTPGIYRRQHKNNTI